MEELGQLDWAIPVNNGIPTIEIIVSYKHELLFLGYN